MRSGLFSRLNELGLVRREKHGKYIRYHITDAGKKYVKCTSEKDDKTGQRLSGTNSGLQQGD